MQELLESKNTYMNYFKKEEIKNKEELEEKTKSHVKLRLAQLLIVLL